MVPDFRVDRCFEPYLSNEDLTIEEVEEAYEEAVRDIHPDLGGHRKAFFRVNKAANKLRRSMEEDETYTIKPKKEDAKEYKKTGNQTKNIKQKLNDDISIQNCWEEGLEQVEDFSKSKYDLVDYLQIRDDLSVGRFENNSEITFSIEAQLDERLALFKTTYYVEDYGEIDDYRRAVFDSEVKELEDDIQEISMEAAEKVEEIKSRFYI